MGNLDTDVDWELWGQTDPYYAVITNPRFRRQNLTDADRIEFFESGRRHIKHVLGVCRKKFDRNFSPKRALDFGCGVGRLLIPLAEVSEHVVGLDVSESMLNEARRNCGQSSLSNVSLLKSNDDLSSLEGSFDLIHSFIVLQHVPVDRGTKILKRILEHLDDGGMAAIQLTYSKIAFQEHCGVPPANPPIGKLIKSLRVKPILKSLRKKAKRFVRGDRARRPRMQMNPYNINKILFLVQSAGIPNFYTEFTDHNGELGLFLYFQKPKKA